MTDTAGVETPTHLPATGHEYQYVHDFSEVPTRFRFKSHPSHDDGEGSRRKRRKISEDDDGEDDAEGSSRRRHKHSHSHGHGHGHGHRRRRGGEKEKRETSAQTEDPSIEMDPEAAFRESLFDAMADDEGALYWEGVYGQPIHNYPNTRPAHPDSPDGELEQMSDEEYAAYVRARMWEKTHQHVIEERKLREEAERRKRRAREENERLEQDRAAFEKRMEESLRRGAQRKAARVWRDAWTVYTRSWEALVAKGKARTDAQDDAAELSSRLPWPVLSGKGKDVDKGSIEDFFHNAVPTDAGQERRQTLRATLKRERVRWHPDRMSHLLRGQVDDGTLKLVTAVFQVVDAMWAETNE